MELETLETPVGLNPRLTTPLDSRGAVYTYSGRLVQMKMAIRPSEDSFVFLFRMRLPNANLFSTVRGYYIYKDIWQCNGLVAVQ